LSINNTQTYWLKDPLWFSPTSVIFHYLNHIENIDLKHKNSKKFRKAEELFTVAKAVIGIQTNELKQYWIQPVSDLEGSPDVRTGCFISKDGDNAPDFTFQDVEVVVFLPKENEDIVSFLGRTKLSANKAYDNKTIILCHILKSIHISSMPQISEDLKNINAVCPVVILGRIDIKKSDYILFQVHPQFKIISKYNLEENILLGGRRGVLNLQRGSKLVNNEYPNEKHCPFESLGFECPIIKKMSSNNRNFHE
jgi:hypothetical protein